LESQGYNCEDYKYFSTNEIDTMVKNNQLDMLITRNDQHPISKTYIKYLLEEKQLRPQVLDKLIEDLFDLEEVLTDKSTDSIIIVTNEEPNETMQNKMRYMFDKSGYFIVLHNIRRLQFNLLEHAMVPKSKILNQAEITRLFQEYNIQNPVSDKRITNQDPVSDKRITNQDPVSDKRITNQDPVSDKRITNLPEISRFDPQALAMTLRPGQIVKFTRKSMTAMETPYYRICI
jgi:DNA-directed RNA polymerase subunit H (RpoH/RPB5)